MLWKYIWTDECWIVCGDEDRRIVAMVDQVQLRTVYRTRDMGLDSQILNADYTNRGSQSMDTSSLSRLTNMIVVAMGQNHDVLHLPSFVQWPGIVILDSNTLNEISQACNLHLRIVRRASTSRINDQDGICRYIHFGVDMRMLRVDIVVLFDKKSARGQA